MLKQYRSLCSSPFLCFGLFLKRLRLLTRVSFSGWGIVDSSRGEKQGGMTGKGSEQIKGIYPSTLGQKTVHFFQPLT